MLTRVARPGRLLLIMLLLATAAGPGEADSSLQSAGAVVYQRGIGPSGQPISARIGAGSLVLPGSAVPCASCHGPDGLGRAEGGMRPAPITWQELTKPYGHRHADGRQHPAFTPATLKRAITVGIDPTGNPLDSGMPRFELADEDLDALVAYLMQLGEADTPGVTPTEIVFGMLLASEGHAGAAGRAAEALIRARFEQVNAQGGVYGRHITVRSEMMADEATAVITAINRLVKAPVLALLGAVPAHLQATAAAHVENLGVPLFNVWPLGPQERPDLGRYSFYLLGGLRQEAEGLIDHAPERFGVERPRAALLLAASDAGSPLAGAVVGRMRGRGWEAPLEAAAPASEAEARELVHRLGQGGIDTLLVLGPRSGLELLLSACAEGAWFPHLLLPGSLVGGPGSELPPGFEQRVLLAYPTLPVDWAPGSLDELEALRAAAAAPASNLLADIAAYGMTTVLLQGLKGAGRELTRAGLIAAVEGLHRFETGLTPRITYGPNRRIGAAEARVLQH